ncbi:MAG: hypothetical protein IT363_05960 [Methanoregulaceae archaeon]|nr:hypothetical protein [Methanoregulaceae archaeon]
MNGGMGDEPDFLVGTKPKRDPDSFPESVREAFELEFGVTKDGGIATMIGKTPGWVSTLLKRPEKTESGAIAALIAPLSSKRHKRRILRAWMDARFEVDVLERVSPATKTAKASESTIRRVARQIKEGQLRLAASLALTGAQGAADRVVREQLLDLALVAQQRSNMPGQAMQVAQLIAESGREHADFRRECHGHWARAQIMLQMPNSTPEELQPLLRALGERVTILGPLPAIMPPYILCTDEAVARLNISCAVVFMERGLVQVDQPKLENFLKQLLPRTKLTPKSRRFPYHQLIARIHALLGDTFLAQEHLERAYLSGGRKVLHAKELCGIVQARVIRETDGDAQAQEYLQQLSSNALRRWDLYHVHVIEMDLARCLSRQFE